MRTQLRPDEKLIHKAQQHWCVLLKPLMVEQLVMAAGIAGFIFADESYRQTILIAFLSAMMLTSTWLAFRVIERARTLLIVTNQRIIAEDGILAFRCKETPISKVNNISHGQSVMGRIFGYGYIEIQSAAEMGQTTYRYIANPGRFSDALAQASEERRF